MTPEELAYQQGFLYPLYLILIGGLITGGLIPYFNRLHGLKLKEIEHKREEAQKEIEHKREEAQKRIDREREDYRFELEIKERLIGKISDESSWCFKKLKEISISPVSQRIEKQSDALDETIFRDGQIRNLIDLYFNNPSLKKLRDRVHAMIGSGITLTTFPANSKSRKEYLDKFLKEFNIKLTEKQISEANKEKVGLFEPLFEIFGESDKLYRLILTAQVKIPHAKSLDKN